LKMLRQHEITVRVRYSETDGQGRLHHANFINLFELGRTEMLRAAGISYREFEEQGMMLVVKQIQCDYHLPIRFDDELQLRTTTTSSKGARLRHRYELFLNDQKAAEGETLIACVGPSGRACRLPDWMQLD